MSGIEAFSLACNIIQIINLARETLSTCQDVYHGRSPDDDLRKSSSFMASLAAETETHHQAIKPQGQSERNLIEVARKCNIAARALEDEVTFLASEKAKGSLKATLRVAIKTNWRKRRLERLESSLSSYQKTLDTHLLARICKRSDAIQLQQSKDFNKLEGTLQQFISQYASGHTKLHELVELESKSTRTHVTDETRRIEETLKSHVTSEVSAAQKSITEGKDRTRMTILSNIENRRERKRNQLLRSLKFKDMNQRLNFIQDSHQGTFEWIFRSDDVPPPPNHVSKVKHMPDQRSILWDDFEEWLKSDSDLYWISGKPGSGKSTLVKFLISHPRTEQALRGWKQDTVILSHFLWKPGSDVQNNIKGLLCSLLHQALLQNELVLDCAISNLNHFGTKDSDTDWSVRELKSALQIIIDMYPSNLCIFLDGLDEISNSDGVLDLMRVVDDIRAAPNVKMCLSSRPEPLLRKRLCIHQHLRLEDLTIDDMTKFAAQTLIKSLKINGMRSESRYRFLQDLVRQAEGVFLWLRLAIQSLTRGLEYEESESDLFQRLAQLPDELAELYHDMWKRLNDDTKAHRQCAAWYFNLIIEAEEMTRMLKDIPEARSSSFLKDFLEHPSVFLFMSMSKTDGSEALLNLEDPLDSAKLDQLCARTQRSVQVRCTGLVDFDQNFARQAIFRSADYQRLKPHITGTSSFVHRTAYDFLTDTEQGQDIRHHDTSSPGDRWFHILQAYLATQRISTLFIKEKRGGFRALLATVAHISTSISQSQTNQLLKLCWQWYEHCFLTIYHLQDGIPGFYKTLPPASRHFLSLAIDYGFDEFVIDEIDKADGTTLTATKVLRDSSIEGLRMLEPLLSLNADPNAKGTYNLSHLHKPSSNQMYFNNVIGRFLVESVTLKNLPTAWFNWMNIFLQNGANLNEKAPLAVELTPQHMTDVEWKHLEGTQLTRFGKGVFFVLVGNLAFYANAIISRWLKNQAATEASSNQAFSNDLLEAVREAIALVPPSARVEYVVVGTLEKDSCRRFLDDGMSRTIMGLIESFLCGVDSSGEDFEDLRMQFLKEKYDASGKFEQLPEPVGSCLARKHCGFCFIDENLRMLPEPPPDLGSLHL